MYIWLLITWFFGSFLFSKSLSDEKPLMRQLGNVRVFPILLFMVYIVTAMLVVFTGTSNVDWNDPELMFSVETFPFAIIGTYAFLIGDLMYSRVTWDILAEATNGMLSAMKSIWIYTYCEEDPEVIQRRAEKALQKRREMGW